MPTLVTALLVRNEAGKYLRRVLHRCLEFSDTVLVLDDNSTDGSDHLAREMGCEVRPWTGRGMWGAEAAPRAALWDWGAEVAGDGWLLICDADMVLHGDPRPLCRSTQVNSWAWPLFDMWTDRAYRCDTFWQGHLHPRPWMFRPNSLRNEVPVWPDRGLHTGHAPLNFPYRLGIFYNWEYYFTHLAYDTPQLRQTKHEQYMAKAEHLTPFEMAHASSILDS